MMCGKTESCPSGCRITELGIHRAGLSRSETISPPMDSAIESPSPLFDVGASEKRCAEGGSSRSQFGTPTYPTRRQYDTFPGTYRERAAETTNHGANHPPLFHDQFLEGG